MGDCLGDGWGVRIEPGTCPMHGYQVSLKMLGLWISKFGLKELLQMDTRLLQFALEAVGRMHTDVSDVHHLLLVRRVLKPSYQSRPNLTPSPPFAVHEAHSPTSHQN